MTGDPSIEANKFRRRIAEALMMQGMSGEPVRHWAQGLARLAQAGVGGYEAYRADESDRASEREIAARLGNFPGATSAPASMPVSPPAPSAPSYSPPAPPTAPGTPMAGLPPLTVDAVRGAVTGDNPEMPANWSAAERQRATGVNPMLLSAAARANAAGADLRPGVMGGVRDQPTQDRLLAAGRSQTRNSNH